MNALSLVTLFGSLATKIENYMAIVFLCPELGSFIIFIYIRRLGKNILTSDQLLLTDPRIKNNALLRCIEPALFVSFGLTYFTEKLFVYQVTVHGGKSETKLWFLLIVSEISVFSAAKSCLKLVLL